jgi:3-dehydroquinate synthase
MDTFSFSIPDGTCSVVFYPELTVPSLPPSGGLYVVDTNTASLLRRALNGAEAANTVVIEAGEANKTLASVERILSRALELGLARDSLFVGVGGGVITDMTAFAASLYMRGARLELVPTTLLAMADAAVGGKTGVDYGNSKNCVGTFYPASSIHVCPSVLASLSEAEYRSGLAEVVKTALLYAPKLYEILKNRSDEVLSRNESLMLEVVKRCVQAKARVVERDLRESGERMYLNLGHTFAHALESVAGFGTVTHGEAVAWGIARAHALGERLGVTDGEFARDTRETLSAYGWCVEPIHPSIKDRFEATEGARLLLEAMKSDKKKKGGAVRFILQREMNSTFASVVEDADVLGILT